ncbi:MAG: hypothetical protein SVR81_05040 [Chloroflexota bacterium]|nr:hypothetical protein [Chloroflexota bacterium]
MNVPYISGTAPPPECPLGRYIPPIPDGMAKAWARANLKPGDWILDPFGSNPLVPIELVRAGYPVLVTANNPIQAFLVRILASAPKREDLVAALSDLAVAPKGDERMEPYIRRLYQVNCADCGTIIEADAFLWKKEADQPFAALVDCPNCGAHGEQDLNPEDLERLTDLPPARLHQARALNRIADSEDPLRPQVESALTAYPLRPLIVLQTIINKLDSLDQTPRRRDLLIALVLSAADKGNTLWAYPSPRERPRQIVIPGVYQEKNLWKALEAAIDTWQVLPDPIPVVEYDGGKPEQPVLVLFEGRVRELEPMPTGGTFPGVITTIPRPNQAFWTFSALWTGWIWGQNAVDPIRQVLSRQRYDWNWHTNALMGIFNLLHRLSDYECKTLCLVAELEPMLLLSTLLASDSVGWQLVAYAQSEDDKIAQCHFTSLRNLPEPVPSAQLLTKARQAASDYLDQRGEPAHFDTIHAAIITSLAHGNILAIDTFMENENQFASETGRLLETVFQEDDLLTRVGGGTASVDTGIWWLHAPMNPQPPMIDRLEDIVLQYITSHSQTRAEDLKQTVYEAFPGIYTPSHDDLLNCLESYAKPLDPEARLWQLQESEQPETRQQDINEMRSSLTEIGQTLDYLVKGDDPLLWIDPGEAVPTYSFHILTTAIVKKHMREFLSAAQTPILLIPGGRANLLAYKEERDPVLKAALDRDFVVVKFRLIRDLKANPLISRDLFMEQIRVDPPEYRSSQLALF